MKSILFFLLVMPLLVNAQFITQEGDKKGLIDKSGKTILETVYDNVYLLDRKAAIYVYCSGDKKGLFNFADLHLYPCTYDDVSISPNGNGYVIQSGNLYGYIAYNYHGNDIYTFTIVEPVYTYVNFVGCCHISVARDSLYGLIFDGVVTKELLPCVFDEPVYSDLDLGFYHKTDEKISLARKDTVNGNWFKIPLYSKKPKTAGDIVVDENKYNREIITYHRKSGKKLVTFAGQTETTRIYYNDRAACVVKIDYQNKRRVVSWLSPVTGETLLTVELKNNQELDVDASYSGRNLNETEAVFVREYRAFGVIAKTFMGELKGYEYKAYKSTRTELIQSSGHSSGRKPFFMPGKN
ncbi:MAG TPA: hypothetical protein VK177_15585 [Flavobacteriales bacterium]|nr:hypothetical protein [Flavobacteriales bacterium]